MHVKSGIRSNYIAIAGLNITKSPFSFEPSHYNSDIKQMFRDKSGGHVSIRQYNAYHDNSDINTKIAFDAAMIFSRQQVSSHFSFHI